MRQLPPVLTLHRQGATFILRIVDSDFTQVGQAIAKSVAEEGADALVIVTPTDTRMFSFDSTQHDHVNPNRVTHDAVGPHEEIVAEVTDEGDLVSYAAEDEDEEEEIDPQEEAIRLAQSEEAEEAEAIGEAIEVEDPDVQPAPGMKVVRRPKRTQTPNSSCGRCGGAGKVKTLMENGKAAEGVCPVCQGQGFIRSYGNRPSR